MANTFDTIQNMCRQRRIQMQFNVPPSRIMLVSPYVSNSTSVGYSKADLDMRRKAEILEYNSNKMSTQTNNLTKAEKWSQLVSGRGKHSLIANYITTSTNLIPVVNSNIIIINDINSLISPNQTFVCSGIPKGTIVKSINTNIIVLSGIIDIAALGQNVYFNGSYSNARITAINGLVITLSANISNSVIGQTVSYQSGDTRTITTVVKITQSITLSTNVTIPNNSSLLFYTYSTPYCPTNVSTPTSSSDVPGPIMYLYKDPTIPLYNYASNVNAFAVVESQQQYGWTVSEINNVQYQYNSNTSIGSTITTLIINDIIENPSYTFTITTPITAYITGYVTSTGSISHDISLNLYSIACNVYYNSTIVPLLNGNPTIVLNNSPINSIQKSIHINTSAGTFSSYIFLGNLTIANLSLYTEPGYVYDFNIHAGMSYDKGTSTGINVTSYGLYLNVTDDGNYQNQNTITSANYTPYQHFGFTGQ